MSSLCIVVEIKKIFLIAVKIIKEFKTSCQVPHTIARL